MSTGETEVYELTERSKREQLERQAQAEARDVPLPFVRQTLETWEELPENLRNEVAARALVQTLLNRGPALYLLGFAPVSPTETRMLGKVVFDNPGVRTLLERDMRDELARKPDILARLTEIAVHGSELAAVRASLVLSKVLKWEAPPPAPIQQDGKIINIFGHDSAGAKRVLAGGASPAASDFEELAHEPGDPIPISNPLADATDGRRR